MEGNSHKGYMSLPYLVGFVMCGGTEIFSSAVFSLCGVTSPDVFAD